MAGIINGRCTAMCRLGVGDARALSAARSSPLEVLTEFEAEFPCARFANDEESIDHYRHKKRYD